MNYFELFEIPVSVTVDKSVLAKKYFELQKKYHPDFFVQEDEAAQQEALEKTSELNKAFKILKDPDATIQYLLKIKGLLQEEEKYPLPPEFLMEVMELNENLSDESAAAIADFEKDIYTEVSSIIKNYDDSITSTADLLKLKEYYYKKKYLQRILDRIAG
jgi:molecular chaperone HscB